MRDLKADLELCDRATEGPWVHDSADVEDTNGENICEKVLDCCSPQVQNDLLFIAQSREGWPHAIERAIKAEKALGNETILNGKALAKLNERADKAEALARELVDVLGRVTPRYLAGRLELDLDLVHEANGLLKKAREVLGNG